MMILNYYGCVSTFSTALNLLFNHRLKLYAFKSTGIWSSRAREAPLPLSPRSKLTEMSVDELLRRKDSILTRQFLQWKVLKSPPSKNLLLPSGSSTLIPVFSSVYMLVFLKLSLIHI